MCRTGCGRSTRPHSRAGSPHEIVTVLVQINIVPVITRRSRPDRRSYCGNRRATCPLGPIGPRAHLPRNPGSRLPKHIGAVLIRLVISTTAIVAIVVRRIGERLGCSGGAVGPDAVVPDIVAEI